MSIFTFVRRISFSTEPDRLLRVLFMTLLFSRMSFAQHDVIRFERFGVEQGLSTRHAMCMLQDRYGFLWFGTQVGLNRFDGITCRVFNPNPRDSVGRPQYINSLYEDKEGLLWVSTAAGLARYNRESEDFTMFKPVPGDPGNPNNSIQSLLEDGSGRFWVNARDAIYSFDRSTGMFTRADQMGISSNLMRNPSGVWCEDKAGRVWIGTLGGGLNRFDRTSGRFAYFKNDPKNPASLSSDYVTAIAEDDRGTLLIATYGGLNKAKGGSLGTFERYTQKTNGLPTDTLLSIHLDESGTLWIGTQRGGLCKFDPQTKTVKSYQPDPTHIKSPDNTIERIYEDRQGRLWVWRMSRTSGLYRFDPQTETFTHCKYDPTDAQSLSNDMIKSLYEDKAGALWIVTRSGGISKLDPATKQFRNFVSNPFDWNSLSGNDVARFCEDRSGFIWIATYGGGLNKFDLTKRKFTHYRHVPADPYSISSDYVSVVYEDRAGTLWAGTLEGGLDKFDRRTATFTHFRYSSNNPKSLSSNAVEVLYEDNQGVLWVGTRNGLNAMDRGLGTFTRHFAFDRPEVLQTDIRVIFEIDSGTLWLGFLGEPLSFDKRTGIFKHLTLGEVGIQAILESRERFLWFASDPFDLTRFDPSTGNITKYTDREFFPTQQLRSMLEDNRGNLWLGTSRGLSKFDPRKETFRNYDARDGLQGNEFIDRSAYKSRNGDMYFGGDNGFTVFCPDSIKDNAYIPPVWITTLRIFNNIVRLAKPIVDLDTIELTHDQNNISFEYVALNYTNAAKNQYKYKLGGFDKEWTNAGTVSIANYTNLDPGEYTFRVKGSNNDGLWNEVGDSLIVIIQPPWWATSWAYGAFMTVFGLMLYSIRRYEMNRLGWKHRMQLEHVQTEKLKEVDQMKSRFFANISHEFRTPLTLIMGPIQKWREKAHDDEEERDLGMAARNAQRLLRLINQLLDLTKLEAGGMKLQAAAGNIVPFVKGIAQSFQSSAGRRGVELNVETESDEIEVYFDRDKMEKILTNLLSNAFKFTPAGGAVTVSVATSGTHPPRRLDSSRGLSSDDQSGEYVTITVADTGMGIPAYQFDKIFDRFYQVDTSHTREQEGTGIGLALTKELVELHHGTIHVLSEVGKGTQFTVRLPLGRSHLKAEEIIEAPPSLELSMQPLEMSVPAEENKEESPVESSANQSEVRRTPSGGFLTEKPIVLVVEDNADVRTYMKEYLAAVYRVLEAKDGAEGIDKAKEIIPDLIISDVMMPKKDGYELCRTLKLDEKTSHVPIILLTAKAAQENKIEGLETGADDYLTKPFDAKELLVRVKKLIELRRKLRERFSVGQVLKPGEIAVTSMDNVFLQKLKDAVERHISEEEFSVEELAQEVSMSRSQIFRKLTALTGQAPSDFIRYMRLHRAMDLLKKNAGTVSEIAYAVGFNSVTYFTKCFHQQFGVLPSDLRKQPH